MVVDEAGYDLRMWLIGFLQVVDDIRFLVAFLEDLQLMVFSATIPQQLEVFNKYVTNPEFIQIEPQGSLSQQRLRISVFD